MLIDLKPLIKKNGKLKNEYKVKNAIRSNIRDYEYGAMGFVEKFYDLAVQYKWTWFQTDINIETITEHLVNDVYRIIEKEVDYYTEHKKFRTENWGITFISSGRLTTRPVDFEETKKHIWLEVEFSTTL